MAITKTKFINYIRCPRYIVLDEINHEKLNSDISYLEYLEEEQETQVQEILDVMFDEEGNDITNVKDLQLETMLPYYNKIEFLAGDIAQKYFPGTFKFAYSTKDQESFDFKTSKARYICYVDIYNELNDSFNIIEVKATTSKKFLELGSNKKDDFGNKINNSIFQKQNGIYSLIEDLNLNIEDFMTEKKYNSAKMKLFNRLDARGHYVYDLAVQRYIIENDLKQHNQSSKIGSIKYFLAVLNSEYVFDGEYQDGNPSYKQDDNGNEIISFFDLTSLTKDYMDIIDIDRRKIETYIEEMHINKYPIGDYCENKKTTKCKFMPVCWNHIPKKNSLLNYIDNHYGFTDEFGNKYDRYDLINEGILRMTDIPIGYLNRQKNVIQRQVVETNESYFNLKKIKDGIACIEYPIYHLDFETFPCPIPRYRGEKCYSQSVFQFSLHIEKEAGICDKELDHYGFLASNHDDIREELVKLLCELIGDTGTVLVYNESFEKTRLKELGEIFPIYKQKLNKINSMIFDLMYLVKTNTKLYTSLGYEEEEASLFNFYHNDMNGSFSIKKILPLFSNLTYTGMEIANGTDALITYANFPNMDEKMYQFKYQKLIEYCKQDTWAMVEILNGLRNVVK